MGNFSFLAEGYPQLQELLNDAEAAVERDATDALVRVRKFAEQLSQQLLGPGSERQDLYARIRRLRSDGKMPEAELAYLDRVRVLGNIGAHGTPTYAQANEALHACHRVCSWLVRRELGSAAQMQPYRAPREAFEALLRSAASIDGQARFIGFNARSAGPRARVDDLLVSVTLWWQEDAQSRTCSTDEFLQRLLDGGKLSAVVLGEAGAGKSTLARWLSTRLLAQGTNCIYVPARVLRPERGGQTISLLRRVHEHLAQRHGVLLSFEAFEQLWQHGPSCLIVDALDECGAPHDRERLRDELDAFAQGSSSLVVTARRHEYEHTLLATATFVAELLPWNGDQVRAFFGRWRALRSQDTEQARREAEELFEAVSANPWTFALAQRPIFATLIALLHDEDQAIPNDRGRLFERALTTLLRSWPTQRGVESPITADEQVAWLEQLALSSKEDWSVLTMERVVEVLGATIASSHGSLAITDWLDFVARDVGVLSEDGPNHFVFAHQSLQEYLCARHLLRDDSRIAGAIIERATDWRWFGTCGLAMVLISHRAALIDEVITGVLGRVEGVSPSEWHRQPFWWAFLTAFAREIEIGPDALDRILRRKSREILAQVRRLDAPTRGFGLVQWSPSDFRNCAAALGQGDGVDDWIDGHLGVDHGEALREVLALAACHWTRASVEASLCGRRDRAAAVGALLEFWPSSSLWILAGKEQGHSDDARDDGVTFATFVAAAVGPRAALQWMWGIPDAYLLRFALGVLALPDTEVLAMVLIRRLLVFEPSEARGWLHIEGGRSVPLPSEVRPVSHVQVDEPSNWNPSRVQPALAIQRPELGHFVGITPVPGGARSDITRMREALFPGWEASITTGDFDWWYQLVNELEPIALDIGALSLSMMGPLNLEEIGSTRLRLSYDEQRPSPRQHAHPDDKIPLHIMHLRRLQVTEIAVALRATERAPVEISQRYYSWRLLGRWLAELWPSIEGCLALPTSEERVCLVLALGWLVHQVTGEWPASPGWPMFVGLDVAKGSACAAMIQLCAGSEHSSLDDQRRWMSAILDGLSPA